MTTIATLSARLTSARRTGEHGPPGALGVALGACLRSGDPVLTAAAVARVQAAVEGRTREEAARTLGVSVRTLLRWLATSQALHTV